MNMYLHELKSLRKSAAVWICAILALVVLYFSMYGSMVKDAEEFRKLLGGYPPTVRAMLGISLDTITTILGFYSMIFSFISLFGAIQAMNMGLSILSKEVRERTADFLMVKPVSRPAIVSAKLLAALTVLLATNILYNAVSFGFASAVKTADFNGRLFFLINLSLFFLQLLFLALGMGISVFFNKLRTVLPISLGVVFGLYMVGALLVTDAEDAARFLSPFKYFDVQQILKKESFEAPYLIACGIVVLISIAITYAIYTRKDIHSVS